MKKIMFNDKCSLTKAVIELLKEMTRREPIFEELKKPRFEFDAKGHLCLYNGNVLVHRSRYALNEEVAVAQCYKDAGLSPCEGCRVITWQKEYNANNNCGFYLEKRGKKMTTQQYVEQDHSQADNNLRNTVNIAAATKSFKTLLNAVKKLCDAYEKMRVSQRTLPPDNIKRRNAERIFRLRMEKLLSLQKKTEK